MTKELQEQLKTVAEYDGYVVKDFEQFNIRCTKKELSSDDYYEWELLSNLQYYSSWSAQIPVWSKAFSEADDLVDTMQADENCSVSMYGYSYDKLKSCIKKYHQAIDNNSTTDGFKVLVELIQFINKHKEK